MNPLVVVMVLMKRMVAVLIQGMTAAVEEGAAVAMVVMVLIQEMSAAMEEGTAVEVGRP